MQITSFDCCKVVVCAPQHPHFHMNVSQAEVGLLSIMHQVSWILLIPITDSNIDDVATGSHPTQFCKHKFVNFVNI